MNKGLVYLEKLVAQAVVFLLPTQLAFHLWPEYSFVFGIRVDYLSVAIYLSDLLVVVLLSLWMVNDWGSVLSFCKKNRFYIALFCCFAAFNILFSTLPPASLYKWTKIFETGLLGIYFFKRRLFLSEKTIFTTLFYSAVAFSSIGIAQFFLGHTTGFLYLLGERTFSLSTPGIALVSFAGRSFMRAYSTFPHPNALAGFLAASLIWIEPLGRFKKNFCNKAGTALVIIALVLTFSFNALAFLVAIGTYSLLIKAPLFFSKTSKIILNLAIVVSLLSPFLSKLIIERNLFPQNIVQRADLSLVAGKMISEKFLIGEGLNTFVFNAPRFKGLLSYNWFLQPVHNIFLLIFAETGIVGVIFVYLILFRILKHFLEGRERGAVLVLIFIVLTGLGDHYWLSLQQNLLFLGFFFGTSLGEKA